jgi:hypothetical protein
MYVLGQVTFEDVPGANAATGPAAIITTPSGGSSLPGLAIVAALGLVVWLFLGRGRSGRKWTGRAFGDAPKRRRKNPRRRRNVLVWGG